MTRKNKKGLIITILLLMLILSPILISSICGTSHLNELNYTIKNGREVVGECIELKKESGYGQHSSYLYYSFTLYYQYEENNNVWKTKEYYRVREDRIDELNEMEIWCEQQLGSKKNLIIADNGYCRIADDIMTEYQKQYNFVYIRGGIILAIEILLLICLLILIFFKPKNKNKELLR